MDFASFVARRELALSEGSVYERLRRDPTVTFDPHIYHGGLIYHDRYRAILEGVHRDYIEVGRKADFAMFTLTDTWRTSLDRVALSAFAGHDVNGDNAKFLKAICESYEAGGPPLFVGGQIGPKNDAYTPAEAPAAGEAEAYHGPQLEALARGGVDFLYAATLPALGEAIGIARAMAATGLPYVLSFVIRRSGHLLDGNSLAAAFAEIDSAVPRPPVGYAVNCVYPTVLAEGLAALECEQPGASRRIVSFQSNTSARDPEELDGSSELLTEDPEVLARLMLAVRRDFGVPFFGGCCGTDTSHIASLARKGLLQYCVD
jgi:homocysteine S-methyltransferase